MRVRFFFTSLFLCALATLGAQEYDYTHCINYYNNASVAVGDTRAVALKHKGKVVLFMHSKTRPKAKILKSDPFVGLYLIESTLPKLSYDLLPLDERTLKDKNLIAITAKNPPKGHITARQSDYLQYAHFSSKLAPNSVIGNICYQIYGIGVGDNGFLEKKYIDRFLQSEAGVYGDIGVRLDHKLRVSLSDPFFANNPFLGGDELVSVNGTKLTSLSQAHWIISNLKIGSSAKVSFKRNGALQNAEVVVGRLYGGMLLRDTFLERFGIELSENLQILSMTNAQNSRFKELKVGDRIVWINKTPATLANLTTLLSESLQPQALKTYEGKIQLLVRRGEFEFFIKI
ncbi:PDZ domain-containing protein [Helicobacter sp. MIT 00-7814]|uniref:DUF7488 domain-containing protein n=1 Tax=unclassified Helicobacter TaxID=2593540 RepID=UPI000E1E4262|nr:MULTISPECIES: PDZ domain-containing protein [unclassified Helicobacter]RDU56147.1 PDZ domain-containing protein [Helicobacter sp. MIT 99-10781]RDU56244.1 PDZ domain-containing protein [Helicobacter sp. MIT 00-7814]